MFSFFGAFTGPSYSVAEKIHQRWPDADLVEISQPFHGFAIRFSDSIYTVGSEELPHVVTAAVKEISGRVPDAGVALLRTECWGGICENWGQYVRNGQVVMNEPFAEHPSCKGVLRRLIRNFGVDIGAEEIFEPLSRGFQWKTAESEPAGDPG